MTYPDAAVIALLGERFVACRLESARHGDLARRMGVRWLPGLVVADEDERPAHVEIGFLAPDDLGTELRFGAAVAAMGKKRYDQAEAWFQEAYARPDAERAPDVLYWWGIARYRRSKDFADAQERWREIARRWPGTQWARRVAYAL